MNRLLKDRVSRMGGKDQQSYFRRFFRDAAWNQQRKVAAPHPGSAIDVQAQGVWSVGSVKKVIGRPKNRFLVAVSVDLEMEKEVILPAKSLRLATPGFFTTQKYREVDPSGTAPEAQRAERIFSETTSEHPLPRRRRSCSFTLLADLPT